MPKYLIHGSYNTGGLKGLMKDGGTGRYRAADQAIRGLGGKLEALYFAFGDNDFYGIADMPDSVSAIALSLAINGSGLLSLKTIPLITPKEMDQATKKKVGYRPPGR